VGGPALLGGKRIPPPWSAARCKRRLKWTERGGWGSPPLYSIPQRQQDNERGERYRKVPQTLVIGSLNVRGCGSRATEWKRKEIEKMMVKRKMDVLAMSETKLKGKGELVFGCMCGRRSGVTGGHAREGVAVLLSERLREKVVEWKELSSRLMWVCVKWGVETWMFVSAYGPGTERSVEEREEFWKELSECVASAKEGWKVVVLGDLNARVGDEVVENVIGRYGVPGRNEGGEWLRELCMETDMVIGNTMFEKRMINKFTFVRMDGGAIVDRALMDYVLVKKEVIGRLLDVHVYRGEASGMSDHFLVEAKLKVDGSWKGKERKSVREVVKVTELNKEEKEREYQERMRNEYESIKENQSESVETEWKWFKDAVLRNAREVCGMRKVGGGTMKGSEWWNDEIRELVNEKRNAFEVWLQNRSREAYDRYKDKRREVKVAVRVAKKKADEDWGRRMGRNFEEKRKVFWKEVKRIRKEESGREEKVKDKNGKLLVCGNEVKKRWAEYFEELLNVDDEREANVVAIGSDRRMPVFGDVNDRQVEREEVQEAVKEMKTGKAPGLDGCAAECLKKGGVAVIEWLVRLLNVCFVSGVVPVDWCSACVVPLYKGKGDKYECRNSRGISLLSVVGKLYGRVLIKRVREMTNDVLMEEQSGFRKGRGCVDQVFAVRQVCEKYLAKGKDVFWAFMDLEKAYDRVDREALWQVLRMYGVGGRLMSAVKSFYVGSRACVRVGSETSEWFSVLTGVRQGCVMSPWLFNMFMDGVVKEVNARVMSRGAELLEGNGVSWQVSQLLFADDTALVADSEEKLRRLVVEFGIVCERRKLRVNVGKSKVMRCSRNGVVGTLDIRLNGEVLEEVESFRYLGSDVAANGGLEYEVKHRVNEGCKALGALRKVVNSKSMSMEAKRGLYESVIVPTVLYGAETWCLSAAERKKVDVFEMKCLRSMLGVTRRDRVRNEMVRERTGVVRELSRRVDERVLGWFGHVERMNEERLVKRIYGAEVNGRRTRGRPRLSWMGGVRRVLHEKGLNVEEARRMTVNRNEWRGIVRG